MILGGILGLVVDLDPYKRYFFAGLAGIFLYTSLCSIFPVINDILNECRQHMSVEGQELSEADSQVRLNCQTDFNPDICLDTQTQRNITTCNCQHWIFYRIRFYGTPCKSSIV